MPEGVFFVSVALLVHHCALYPAHGGRTKDTGGPF